jgi:hypothetical protein
MTADAGEGDLRLQSGGDDDAHDREEAGHHGEPGQRDRLATTGDLEVDTDGLSKCSGKGDGRHRRERGDDAGAEPGKSVGRVVAATVMIPTLAWSLRTRTD